jgi:hypothetical protein
MVFVAELNGSAAQRFSNPYDAMAALIGTEGEADVARGHRRTPRLVAAQGL